MIKKILIANRGEIACRVIKTTKQLGIASVAVYSDADAQSLHVKLADEAVHIGDAPAKASYLDAGKILAAARNCGADAIHPGYGFLSENADFARSCEAAGIIFIGPPASAINAMGSKSSAKQIMERAGVPLIPGFHGDDQDPTTLQQQALEIGYPVLLKAAAGGGGKGMRQVLSEEEFQLALESAKRESMNAFGDDKMLIEKYLGEPRHVEIQIFCDQYGAAVYLAERDCSVQRRHQKIIEEAPAPGIPSDIRRSMGEAALRCAQAIDYVGAGTVEFLLDKSGDYFFMEMNTRLQVEHPVTEMITGLDLVAWQIWVAEGRPLPLTQSDVEISGHAVEVRIYAEDPDNGFLPQTGRLEFLSPPLESNNVRVDTGVVQGDDVSVFYDPMIAKLIVWDVDRTRALNRMAAALIDYQIGGLTTNISLLHKIVSHPAFVAAELDTHFLTTHRDDLFEPSSLAVVPPDIVAPMVLYLLLKEVEEMVRLNRLSSDRYSPWHLSNVWRLNGPNSRLLRLGIADQEFLVGVECKKLEGHYALDIDGHRYDVSGELTLNQIRLDVNGHQTRYPVADAEDQWVLFSNAKGYRFHRIKADIGEAIDVANQGGLTAPMNGTIVSLLVEAGALVAKGDALLVMEAMKMEHTIRAPSAGTVLQFNFEPGDLVSGGAVLLGMEVIALEASPS